MKLTVILLTLLIGGCAMTPEDEAAFAAMMRGGLMQLQEGNARRDAALDYFNYRQEQQQQPSNISCRDYGYSTRCTMY